MNGSDVALKLLTVRAWDATEPWTERRPIPLPHWTQGIHWHAHHRYTCHRAYKQVILWWWNGNLVSTFLCLLNNCMISFIHQGGPLGNSFASSTQVENDTKIKVNGIGILSLANLFCFGPCFLSYLSCRRDNQVSVPHACRIIVDIGFCRWLWVISILTYQK